MRRRSKRQEPLWIFLCFLLGVPTVIGAAGCGPKWTGLTWLWLGRLPYWAVAAWPFAGAGVLLLAGMLSVVLDGSRGERPSGG